jgi:hypothetical protein
MIAVISYAILSLTGPAALPRAYRSALKTIAAAKTLRLDVFTTEMDGSHSTSSYVFRKPNCWRITSNGLLTQVCDGKTSWFRDGGKWKREDAPKGISQEDLIPFGFENFVVPDYPSHEIQGPMDWKVNGKTRKAWFLKTTEAGTYAGYIVVDLKTFMPLGHHYSEMGAPGPKIDEYRRVVLNGKVNPSEFQLN